MLNYTDFSHFMLLRRNFVKLLSMEIYLVGGAVRDSLLGLPITERDWVVVGATPAEMLKLGFQPVGKDFPVFLHPQTHEEYALARTERKTGKGYKGFAFYSASDVTLIEDLQRRDLTINAIAQAEDGTLIDPYHGQLDLKRKLLRHVSPAFQEDPVRILRTARFAARFTDFDIHPSTYELMEKMVREGEVDALVAERVWQEFRRALESVQPWRFLEILERCQALVILFPQIKLTPELKTLFENAIKTISSPPIRFAVLTHNLTQTEIQDLINRYRIPREYADLALLTAKWRHVYAEIFNLSAAQIYELLKSVDARRRPERFENFISACAACTPHHPLSNLFLQSCVKQIQIMDIQDLIGKNLKGEELAKQLAERQINIIETEKQKYPYPPLL